MRQVPGALVALALLVGAPVPAAGHEERLAVGRVEAVDDARSLLVLTEAGRSSRLRLQVTPETDVVVCGTAAGLAAVAVGSMVRIKYLDRADAEPQAQSVLLLGTAGRPGR